MKLPLKRYTYQYWYILCFIFIGVFFRFYALGVNYFGGDELSTIDYLVHYGKTTPSIQIFLHFLADQDRGPGQYLINFINIFIFGYINEFQLRFPYFIFSIFSIYTLFLLSKYTFKSNVIAVFTAYLFSFNGLFIMFGRVSQYQSLLTFLIPLSVYFYFKGFEENKTKLILLSSVFYSLCLTFHFDALSALVLYSIYFLVRVIRNFKSVKMYEDIRKFLIFGITLILLTGSVYLPYLFSDQKSTTAYLGGRIFGRYFLYPNNTYDKLGRILELYMPLESWILVLVLCFIGLSTFALYTSTKKIKILKTKLVFSAAYVYLILLTSFSILFIFTSLQILGRLGSLIIFIFTFLICFILVFAKKLDIKIISLAIWFLTSFYIYFYLFNDPRTHIYISFLPGLCFAGVGFEYLYKINKSKIYKSIFLFIFIIFSLFNTYFYYLVFVDKNPEYLWYPKKFLYKDMPFVNRSNNNGLKLFAFTTNNHFTEIKELFNKNCLIGSYASNEKWETTSFYLERRQVSLDIRNLPQGPDNIIYFVSPNIWNSLTLQRANSFIEYKLLKTYYTYGKPTVYIFGKKTTYDSYKNPCPL